jgi:hypothetical protein
MTLAATGKTPADHGISLIAEKDCATWRPFTGKPICSDAPADQPDASATDVASAEAVPSLPQPAPLPQPTGESTFSSWALPDIPATEVAAAPAVPVNAAPSERSATSPARPGPDSLYLVVASFDATDRAQTLAGRYAALKPQVVRGEAKGATVYRVVVGPLARSAQAAERRRLQMAGIADAWALPATTKLVVVPQHKPVQVADAGPGR